MVALLESPGVSGFSGGDQQLPGVPRGGGGSS